MVRVGQVVKVSGIGGVSKDPCLVRVTEVFVADRRGVAEDDFFRAMVIEGDPKDSRGNPLNLRYTWNFFYEDLIYEQDCL